MKSSTSYAVHQLHIEMERLAALTLVRELNISYSRFYFLLCLGENPDSTQHAIALAMGLSDPAVSRMLKELVSSGLVHIKIDSTHRKRRIANLTTRGAELLEQSIELLDNCFSDVAIRSAVAEAAYCKQTERLTQHMQIKYKEEL